MPCSYCEKDTLLQKFNCKTCGTNCCEKCFFPSDSTCDEHPTPLRAVFLDHGSSVISRWKIKQPSNFISKTFKDECSRAREMLRLCLKQMKTDKNSFWLEYIIGEEDVEILRQFIRDQERIYFKSEKYETKLACITRVRSLANEISLDEKTAKEKSSYKMDYINNELKDKLNCLKYM